MATLYKSSGEVQTVTPANGQAFTLKEMQTFVGGYIEYVQVGSLTIIVNEEGLPLRLPPNPVATVEMRGLLHSNDTVVLRGDVLFASAIEMSRD